MLSWQKFAGCTAAAAIAICLMSTAGCRQLSRQVRTEDPVLEKSSPVPPDFLNAPPSPQLEPVPQRSTRRPQLPAPELIPPPAPPAESARMQPRVPGEPVVEAWDQEPVELVDDADEEYFSGSAPAYPPAFVTERSASYAEELAAAGQAARQRKETREPLWPVIVPGVSTLKPVTVQEPVLAPVPK